FLLTSVLYTFPNREHHVILHFIPSSSHHKPLVRGRRKKKKVEKKNGHPFLSLPPVTDSFAHPSIPQDPLYHASIPHPLQKSTSVPTGKIEKGKEKAAASQQSVRSKPQWSQYS
ncbi:unnamed protein product, partial [Tuber aestivum]